MLFCHPTPHSRCCCRGPGWLDAGAVPAFNVGSATGTVFFDHLAWLLGLSPRLVLLMQGSLGRSAVEGAERTRSGRGQQQQQQQQVVLTQPASPAGSIRPMASIDAARCQMQSVTMA
ncbi:hypothetical protein Vretimale_15720 [Volvox reticuliferus]|nr:hypothetical protein Vretifemale_18402 [Volvox reticuliferus]GIM12364.1 hypothetical protein Vretimale_15720 [Volvox reticuliferus]